MKPKSYSLPIPEPIRLWKWAARNSQRHADGLPLSLVGFYKRAVRSEQRQPGESHADFAKRALREQTRLVMAERRQAGGICPDWVGEMFAAEMNRPI